MDGLEGRPVTFVVLVASFVGCACLIVPLVILAAFALFDRGEESPVVGHHADGGVTRPGG